MNSEQKFSPFWPLTMVFLALVVGYSIQLSGFLDQRKKLQMTETGLKQAMPQVQILNGKLRAVSLDLVKLAPNNPNARQIVAEFGIQFTPPKK
ncbi:MAG: hypothetical protein PHV34_19875 [Verrucomicrobiae bacterium]|nr:hypothetical protein [Verrucomicrobiae bacterium]